MIPNAEGARTTPSVVGFAEDGECLVGQVAKRQAVMNPQNTIDSIKRFMGRRYDEVTEEMKRVPFVAERAENGEVRVDIEETKFSPPEISALVLGKLKQAAEDHLGQKVTEAVVTVPTTFDIFQRQATRDAGRIAGLEVKRLINEPTAAALAYGLDRKTDQKIAVYDFGGGAFSISILEVGHGAVEEKSINGDPRLGGDLIDQAIIDWLLADFETAQGIDLAKDPMAIRRLKAAAEEAKISLSTTQEAAINLPFIATDVSSEDASSAKHLKVKLTRARLEQLVESLIDCSLIPCRQALGDAGLVPSDIDEVLLVGAQTRMPMIQRKVREFFGKEPHKGVNPDEAVAIGAAIQGGVLAGVVTDVLLLPVTPRSLGIETLGGVATKLIERNTTIPTRKSEVFSTVTDSQTCVEVHVLEGEREMAKDCRTLGRFQLTDIPPAARGVPQIEATFDIDANGLISVSAKDRETGQVQKIDITTETALKGQTALVSDGTETPTRALAVLTSSLDEPSESTPTEVGDSDQLPKADSAKGDDEADRGEETPESTEPPPEEPPETPPPETSREAEEIHEDHWQEFSDRTRAIEARLHEEIAHRSALQAQVHQLERDLAKVQDQLEDKPKWPRKFSRLQRRVQDVMDRPHETAAPPWQEIPPERLLAQLKERGFYLPLDVCRSLLSALIRKRIVILEGVPGTGKSILAKLLPQILLESHSERQTSFSEVSIHPDLSTEEFIGGRTITGDHQVGPACGPLLDAILCCHESADGYWLLMDEFNRCSADMLFAPLLDAFASPQGNVQHPHMFPDREIEEARIPIPNSFRIIGTLNPLDRGLFQVSQALHQRLQFVPIPILPDQDEDKLVHSAVIEPWLSKAPTGDRSRRAEWARAASHRVRTVATQVRALVSRPPTSQFAACEIGSRIVMATLHSLLIQLEVDELTVAEDLPAVVDLHVKNEFLRQLEACGTEALQALRDEVFSANEFEQTHFELSQMLEMRRVY